MMVDYDDSLFQCGTDEKMEFALRRLERFFGIDRSEVTATYIHSDSTVDTVIFPTPSRAFAAQTIRDSRVDGRAFSHLG